VPKKGLSVRETRSAVERIGESLPEHAFRRHRRAIGDREQQQKLENENFVHASSTPQTWL
jgi:hypothetical protein